MFAMDLSVGISITANYVCIYLESMKFKRSIIVLAFFSYLMSLTAQTPVNYSTTISLLEPKIASQIKTNTVRTNDSSNIYLGDENSTHLFYQSLIPKVSPKGTVVLMPGTWETTEHVWNSMSEFCKLAQKNNLAVLVLSINQRLTLTSEIVQLINSMCANAIETYHLPRNQFVFGGFSMGGIFCLRYAEFAVEDSTYALIRPKAVFSCDGPCDLKHIYQNFQRKKDKNPGLNEPKYGIAELEAYCEGNPNSNPEKYEYYSPFSFDDSLGGNAKFLINMPLRIYADVDPVWWMQNRHVDMYDLNALDQTALIQLLNDMGNTKAEFINAFQKGIRIEGNRHPHSWSIIESKSCVNWILSNLN